MKTRSQTCAANNEIVKKKNQIQQAIVIETPEKQTQTQVNAPRKKTENSTNRYCTRSTTNKNLTTEFDAAFFDDSSEAWMQNKKKLGNGMYTYLKDERLENTIGAWVYSHFGQNKKSK